MRVEPLPAATFGAVVTGVALRDIDAAGFAELYQAWLEHAGLKVTVAPSRAFLEAYGTAQQVEQLLHIVFVPLPEERFSVHTFNGPVKLPATWPAS